MTKARTVADLGAVTSSPTELNYSTNVTSDIQAQIDTKANASNAALTGTPTAPTASASTNTTQVATTAYVTTAVAGVDLSSKANIDAPNFTTDIEVDNLKLDGNTISSTDTNGNIILDPQGTGNVGVHCIPSSIQSGFNTLQIGGNLTLNVDSTGASAGVYMGNNVYRDGTNSRWEYIYTDEATQYVQANGEHIWRSAASGTADTAITFSEKFRFGTAGQLGIGGTTYGTSGQVLTSGGASAAPTWADAGGGAFNLVGQTVTSSDVANIKLFGSNAFTTTYDDYLIIFHTQAHSTSNDYYEWRFTDDSGTEESSSNYAYVIGSETGQNSNQYNQDAFFADVGLLMYRENYQHMSSSVYMYVAHPKSTTFWARIAGYYSPADSTKQLVFSGAYRSDAATFGGISFNVRGSNNFRTGSSLKIYGIAKS